MNDGKNDDVRDRGPLFWGVGIGAVVGGFVMYLWLMLTGAGSDDTLSRFELFASLGDAMAPFAAILSAAALFAAIDGVRLQRLEFQKGLEFMRDQAEATNETARVQKQLVVAQEALTRRQYEANVRAHFAQIVAIESDALKLLARMAEVRHSESSTSDILENELDEVRLRFVRLREYYERKAGGIVGVIHITGHHDQDSFEDQETS